MARPLANLEYEVYVPLSDADGVRFSKVVLDYYRARLVEHFGGLTDLKHRNEGIWKVHGIEYYDEIVIWRVLSSDTEGNDEQFFSLLKGSMMKDLKQKDILIVRKSAEII